MPDRRTITLALLLYTTAGFVASAAVHFLLYFGFNLSEASPPLWLFMHVSVVGGWVGIYFLQRGGERFGRDISRERAPYPLVAMTVLYGVFLFYALINFFYYEEALKGGYPGVVDGRQVLVLPHGQGRRPLTPEEFARAEVYRARKNSGHWMVCHLIPCMMLYVNYKFEEFS